MEYPGFFVFLKDTGWVEPETSPGTFIKKDGNITFFHERVPYYYMGYPVSVSIYVKNAKRFSAKCNHFIECMWELKETVDRFPICQWGQLQVEINRVIDDYDVFAIHED